jgi:cytochrome c-type biogenesis protein CcmH/NrfG
LTEFESARHDFRGAEPMARDELMMSRVLIGRIFLLVLRIVSYYLSWGSWGTVSECEADEYIVLLPSRKRQKESGWSADRILNTI